LTRRSSIRLLAQTAVLAGLSARKALSQSVFDVVVYGGTAAGVVAAVAAARQGARVALIEPGSHLGGMVSSGLGATDTGNPAVIGGLCLEFFQTVGKAYGTPVQYNFPPSVAEAAFQTLVASAGVNVFLGQALAETNGVAVNGTTITSITLADGSVFPAAVFVDATYEGDLMSQSGVTCTYGRESSRQYCEWLGGVQAGTRVNGSFALDPYDASGNLLPEISSAPRGIPGQWDQRVQAYTFRLCATMDPANLVPFPQPPGYDAGRYELALRYLQALPGATFENAIAGVVALPDGKFDINGGYFFSTDYVGGSAAYPTASSLQRSSIWQAHYQYQAGLLYFIASDSRVPAAVQQGVNAYGLAADEFTDSDNWPPLLYVREARRMLGSYVLTQSDMTAHPAKPDSIGMGSYPFDSHSCQRVLGANNGTLMVQIEGEFNPKPPTQLFQIPYRAILPVPSQISNLLVPVCCSASHVGFCAIRLEPQYMVMGEAAGTAAAIASLSRTPPAQLNVAALQAVLSGNGAVLSLPGASEERGSVCRDFVPT
jgi:hypothetical protein